MMDEVYGTRCHAQLFQMVDAAFDLNDGYYVRSREMDSFAQDLWPVVATVKVQVLMS